MEHLSQFIYNHWQLCLALVLILIFIFIHEYLELQKQGKRLTPEAAIELINHQNAVVIDLRSADLFKKGHIIDAVRAAEADFDSPKMDKYKTKPMILVCARGLQSTTLAKSLRTKGFSQPLVLTGGIAAWQAANLPLVKK